MKKVLIAFIALLGVNVYGIAQTVTPPTKKTDEKIKVDPVKPATAPLKVAGIPKTFSKVPPKNKIPIPVKTPAAEKPKVATPTTAVILKKDGTPDKRYKTGTPANPVKKDGTPDMRYKKNKKGKSK